MDFGGATLSREDAGGLLPLLFMVSGYAAMERGSELIEPRDLIKAIYVADLEHVSIFWNDWEGLERLVSSEKLVTGNSGVYINRILYLIGIDRMSRESEGVTVLGRPSQAFKEIMAAARKLASERTGAPSTPSSRDLLFCACSQDPELSAALQKSGLRLEKLAAAVGKSGV
ncbi:MAG TPA: hypothetical protein VK699_05510 [Terriglobales bacterium]|jgi:hypothetical protein|nr:hypothetical protein [Terriglobales bacterium]